MNNTLHSSHYMRERAFYELISHIEKDVFFNKKALILPDMLVRYKSLPPEEAYRQNSISQKLLARQTEHDGDVVTIQAQNGQRPSNIVLDNNNTC